MRWRAILIALFAWTALHLVSVAAASYPTPGWERRASDQMALTAALYWEGAPNESAAGLRAIAWSIRNRLRSGAFPRDRSMPRTIRGVVLDGARRGRHGRCQFSFACNGVGETPRDYCQLTRRIGYRFSLKFCQERWARHSRFAASFLRNPGKDPTRGATMYFAGRKPYWYRDLEKGSVRKIGSHHFGRTRHARTVAARR